MLAPKKRTILSAIVLLILLTFIGVFIYSRTYKKVNKPACAIEISEPSPPDVVGYVPEMLCVELEPATTASEREIGLSKYSAIKETQGMLFTYDEPGEACIWMKDMNFPIDIVWLDADKKIVKIEINVDPSTYPKTFCSNVPAKYVVELNAYISSYAYLEVGQQLAL